MAAIDQIAAGEPAAGRGLRRGGQGGTRSVPSTEVPAPGAPVEVKMTDVPVLVTERR